METYWGPVDEKKVSNKSQCLSRACQNYVTLPRGSNASHLLCTKGDSLCRRFLLLSYGKRVVPKSVSVGRELLSPFRFIDCGFWTTAQTLASWWEQSIFPFYPGYPQIVMTLYSRSHFFLSGIATPIPGKDISDHRWWWNNSYSGEWADQEMRRFYFFSTLTWQHNLQ